MFDQCIIASEALRELDHGQLGPCISLAIRPNWYRALPFSALQAMRIEIDDQPVDENRIQALPEGTPMPLGELTRLVSTQWFVLDSLELLIATPERLARGQHRIRVSYEMRITDLLVGGHSVTEAADATASLDLA